MHDNIAVMQISPEDGDSYGQASSYGTSVETQIKGKRFATNPTKIISNNILNHNEKWREMLPGVIYTISTFTIATTSIFIVATNKTPGWAAQNMTRFLRRDSQKKQQTQHNPFVKMWLSI